MVIVYQNDDKDISSQNLVALSLVYYFLLPFSSPFSGMSGNHLHILHMCSMISCCVETAGGSVPGEVIKQSPSNQLLAKKTSTEKDDWKESYEHFKKYDVHVL